MMIDPERYSDLGELLADALVQYKSSTALIEMERDRENARYTYLEVKRAAEALALRLASKGIGPGDRVAIVMSNQSRWLITACAIFFRGAVLVPIDYKLTPGEQEALLRHASPKLLVTEYPVFRALGASDLPFALVTDAPEAMRLENAERFESTGEDRTGFARMPRRREDPATIVYSSGTGGRPKGCVLSHGAYLAQYGALSRLFPITAGHRYFSILPTNHAIDFMCGFVGPFGGGATVVHQRTLRPEFLTATMKRHRITHMAVVPLLLEAFERKIREKLEDKSDVARHVFDGLTLLNSALTARRPNPSLSRRLLRPVHEAFGGELELLFCGGAFVDRARAQFFYDLGIPVVIGYGLTEACTVLTVNDLKPFRPDSVGRTLPGVEIEIRNPDPETGIGEVWARGPTLMSGYLDDPEQTAEVLVDGWLRTGDLGSLDAADHLHLVGRSKNMIVTAGGKNISPEDIESAFEGLACDELVVCASGYVWPGGKLEDECLFVVLRGGDASTVAELRARNQRLPDFKRVRGVLHASQPFPRTASMKVKRDELARILREEHTRGQITAFSS